MYVFRPNSVKGKIYRAPTSQLEHWEEAQTTYHRNAPRPVKICHELYFDIGSRIQAAEFVLASIHADTEYIVFSVSSMKTASFLLLPLGSNWQRMGSFMALALGLSVRERLTHRRFETSRCAPSRLSRRHGVSSAHRLFIGCQVADIATAYPPSELLRRSELILGAVFLHSWVCLQTKGCTCWN